MPPDEPNDEEREEELPEDNGTPFQPAASARDMDFPVDDDSQGEPADTTRPETDDDVDSQELYDEGYPGIVDTPNKGDVVTGYDPTKDRRKRNGSAA